MNPDSSPAAIVNWSVLGARLRRPVFWMIFAAVVVGAAAGALARPFFAAEAPGGTERRFRFDEVYVVEESSQGNESRIRIVPWVSNPSTHATKSLQLVVHVIGDRSLVLNVSRLDLPAPRGLRTESASAGFTINNTHNYKIEVLALVDGLLVAKGWGSIGFQDVRLYDGGELTMRAALTAGGFSYDYMTS